MNDYVDLHICRRPDLTGRQILEALFRRIHLALALSKKTDVGLSFPEVNEKTRFLGYVLRLHGLEPSLRDTLHAADLSSLRDCLKIGEISKAPSKALFRTVSRRQVKFALESLRRRKAARHNLTISEAAESWPDSARKKSNLPYIMVHSLSTNQKFPIFIKHGELAAQPTPGHFNFYGLSSKTTIPWFGGG